MGTTRDFSLVIEQQLANDPALRFEVEREQLNAEIAGAIVERREELGQTQKQLATKAGTHQSVIARLEDADYGGYSVSMLCRIADALDCRLSVTFKPRQISVSGEGASSQSWKLQIAPEWLQGAPIAKWSEIRGIPLEDSSF